MKLNKTAEKTIETIKVMGATDEQVKRIIALATAHCSRFNRRVIKCADVVRAEFIVLGKWVPKNPTPLEIDASRKAADSGCEQYDFEGNLCFITRD